MFSKSLSILKKSSVIVPLLLSACGGTDVGIIQTSDGSGKVAIIGEAQVVEPQSKSAEPFGFMVKLIYQVGTHRCGGSLISADTVLTAAHCVEDANLAEVFVGPAGLTRDTMNDGIAIKEIIIHPKYKMKIVNGQKTTSSWDLALLKLAKPVAFKPIAISSNPEISNPKVAIDAQVAGWGSTSRYAYVPSEKLLKAATTIQPKDKCADHLPDYFQSDNMICTNSPEAKANVCPGDSGGPIVVIDPETQEPQLVGTAMWGEACSRAKEFGYTAYSDLSVPEIQEWIQNPKKIAKQLYVNDSEESIESEVYPYVNAEYSVRGELVYLKHGSHAEFAEKEVKGKIALIDLGMGYTEELLSEAVSAGAVGVILRDNANTSQSRFSLETEESIPTIVIGRKHGLDLIRKLRTESLSITIQNKLKPVPN